MSLASVNTHLRPCPLLIVPLRCCASHALRERLSASPQFHSPSPLDIVDFLPLVPLYGDLHDDVAYRQMVKDVVGLQAIGTARLPALHCHSDGIFEALREEPRSVHRIVWDLLLRSGELQGASVVMDNSLDNIHHAHDLTELFPDMLFLHVVRDPRAQVASMNRAIIHDFDTTLNTLAWVRAHSAACALALSHPARVLTIRYEDLLADQEDVLRRICRFAAMEFLPGMLDIAASREAQDPPQKRAVRNTSCFAPLPAHQDTFKALLPPHEIETIESLAWEHMHRYGYECVTEAQEPYPTALFLAQCRQQSERRRGEAWDQLLRSAPREYSARRVRAEYLRRVRLRLEHAGAHEAGAPALG